jgi:hypothetical protein
MGMARDDGYIRRVGANFRGIKWDTTEWADLQLLDTPHIRTLESEIVDFVSEFGIVSLDHISAELGLEDEAPELRAALERTLLEESVKWYCNGLYGLPSSDCETFEPKRDLWAETKPATEDKDFGAALEELESAVKGLSRAMKSNGVLDQSVSDVAAGEPDEDDPYANLRRLQELHDAGVLTAEEFAAKKAEILKRI